MMKGLISIIVPVYNVEKYLHKCIDSIIGQTYKNLEILLIDDGSTDRSGIICDDYSAKDSRIKVIHKENGGQASARNLALTIAKGEYIGFVDSDDWIEPDMYEILYNAIIDNNADISMCGRNNISESSGLAKPFFSYPIGFSLSNSEAIKRFLLFDGIDSAGWDKLFKRKIAINHRFPLGLISEDLLYIYKCIKEAEKIYHVGIPLYNYLQRNNSTSRSKYSKKTNGLYIYPKEIREDVIKKYPKLKKEADYYMFFEHFVFYRILDSSDVNIKDNTEKTSFKYLLDMLLNPYLDMKTKSKFVLFRLNMYRVVRKSKKMLK